MPESYIRGALTEATYLILLSLCETRHGYAVMQHIASITQGRVNLGIGTLYGAINLLLDKGWIETVGNDDRRKLYRITAKGKSVLEGEIARLSELTLLGQGTFTQIEGADKAPAEDGRAGKDKSADGKDGKEEEQR